MYKSRCKYRYKCSVMISGLRLCQRQEVRHLLRYIDLIASFLILSLFSSISSSCGGTKMEKE